VIGEQEIGIADDRGQHVVEVMRNAAGELADGLHLLALHEVLLQGALFGVSRAKMVALAPSSLRGSAAETKKPRRPRRPRPLERDVEGSDLALALSGGVDRCAQGGAIALGDKVENR